MRAEDGVDHLAPEDGVFSFFSGSLPYQLAVRKALTPPRTPDLQMVVLPSFEVESGVFVCRVPGANEWEVHSGRLVGQLWGEAAEQCLTPPTRKGAPAVFRPPTPDVFERLHPDVRWSSPSCRNERQRRCVRRGTRRSSRLARQEGAASASMA